MPSSPSSPADIHCRQLRGTNENEARRPDWPPRLPLPSPPPPLASPFTGSNHSLHSGRPSAPPCPRLDCRHSAREWQSAHCAPFESRAAKRCFEASSRLPWISPFRSMFSRAQRDASAGADLPSVPTPRREHTRSSERWGPLEPLRHPVAATTCDPVADRRQRMCSI